MGNAITIEGVHVEGLEIKGMLGEGSFGIVYKGKWHGKFVAVKKLKDEILRHPSEVDKFKKECGILRELKHPNIVELLEVIFLDNTSPVLITELLWCDLHAFYKDSKMKPKVALDETIKIMLNVAEGLRYLHSRDIVHRDIKSRNILLDSKLKAKIADLGQAKELCGRENFSSTYATPVPGTIVYMAPETFPVIRGYQILGDVDYGAELDIFSFGVVLLELIIGHLPNPNPIWTPYTKDGELVIEHRRRGKELSEMGMLHPLRETVLQCLENDPTKRPAISQVIRDLRYNDGSQKKIELKIALLGSSGVGKSLLIKRYIDSDFPCHSVPSTIGVDRLSVPLEIENQLLILRLLDPAGQERFDSIAPALFRSSHGAFLIYDVSEPRSFEALPKFMKFIQSSCGENAKVMLVGNKNDLPRRVELKRAQNYAEKYDMEYLEVSAKTLDNVDEMFERLAQNILDSLEENDVHILEKSLCRQQSRINLTDEQEQSSKCNC